MISHRIHQANDLHLHAANERNTLRNQIGKRLVFIDDNVNETNFMFAGGVMGQGAVRRRSFQRQKRTHAHKH